MNVSSTVRWRKIFRISGTRWLIWLTRNLHVQIIVHIVVALWLWTVNLAKYKFSCIAWSFNCGKKQHQSFFCKNIICSNHFTCFLHKSFFLHKRPQYVCEMQIDLQMLRKYAKYFWLIFLTKLWRDLPSLIYQITGWISDTKPVKRVKYYYVFKANYKKFKALPTIFCFAKFLTASNFAKE